MANIEQQLINRLNVLQPIYLEILNESSQHGGYFPGKESHFKVIIVSKIFENLRLVQRHQKVYQAAGELIGSGKIHALAIHAYTSEDWLGKAPESPNCAHKP